jgi:hypothetical protein
MRVKTLLIAGIVLALGACSNYGDKGSRISSYAVVPLDKTLLTGKWKNVSDVQFLIGYEFSADGAMKTTFRGMKEAVPGRYTWTGERTLEVEHSKMADVQQAYETAAKAYKDDVANRVNKKKLDGRAGAGMMKAVADKLPTKEVFCVGISNPRFLVLTREDGATVNFEKED